MDKGIRPAVIAKFAELLPTRVNTREGNTVFRKTVMASIMEDFGITLASAATHYNHAFIEAKKNPANETLLAGLGRPEDKKGGRKKKEEAAPVAAAVDPGSREAVLANMLKAVGGTGSDEAPASEETKDETPQGDAAPVDAAPQEDAAPEAPVQKYSVCKVSDKTVVCSDLTLDEANALIAKAAAAKKAKLELVA